MLSNNSHPHIHNSSKLVSSTSIVNLLSLQKMNRLQPEQMREMEEFKSANHAYESELLKLENSNSNNITPSGGHYRSSEDQVRRRVQDYPPPPSNGISSSSTASTWIDNFNNKNKRVLRIQRKSSWINDPEMKRQRRVVRYKAYAVEGKVKASLRNGFRWVKNKYIQLVHGY